MQRLKNTAHRQPEQERPQESIQVWNFIIIQILLMAMVTAYLPRTTGRNNNHLRGTPTLLSACSCGRAVSWCSEATRRTTFRLVRRTGGRL